MRAPPVRSQPGLEQQGIWQVRLLGGALRPCARALQHGILCSQVQTSELRGTRTGSSSCGAGASSTGLAGGSVGQPCGCRDPGPGGSGLLCGLVQELGVGLAEAQAWTGCPLGSPAEGWAPPRPQGTLSGGGGFLSTSAVGLSSSAGHAPSLPRTSPGRLPCSVISQSGFLHHSVPVPVPRL